MIKKPTNNAQFNLCLLPLRLSHLKRLARFRDGRRRTIRSRIIKKTLPIRSTRRAARRPLSSASEQPTAWKSRPLKRGRVDCIPTRKTVNKKFQTFLPRRPGCHWPLTAAPFSLERALILPLFALRSTRNFRFSRCTALKSSSLSEPVRSPMKAPDSEFVRVGVSPYRQEASTGKFQFPMSGLRLRAGSSCEEAPCFSSNERQQETGASCERNRSHFRASRSEEA